MRSKIIVGFLGLVVGSGAGAQNSCSRAALPEAAKAVAGVRHQLRAEAVSEADAMVPAAIGSQLGELKAALAQAAQAAFACAEPASTPEQMQSVLAEALGANLAEGTDSVLETRNGKDVGTYGSDLGVQVFQLSGKPQIFEVDFRYGIECGDDHLLLVYEADGGHGSEWKERLRWSASGYKTIADAFGEFVMLTPVTGSYEHPVWRFVVAHGQPGCAATPRPSRFAMDLLAPTADPARPRVDWHFEQAYTASDATPRLSTTENTIELRFVPAGAGKEAAQVYRVRLGADGKVVGSPTDGEAEPVTSSSPQ